MALVTLQRSPSPSNDPDEESAEGTEDGQDGRSSTHRKRSKSTLERLRKIFSTVRFISKLRPCLSESYFTVKGAALILPHSDVNRKTSRKNHGGEIQRHLQSMLYLLRPEDKIKVAIRLESQQETEHRYMALVSSMGRQDTEECVLLGMDCCTTPIPAPPTPPTTPSTLLPPGVAVGGGLLGSPGEGSGVLGGMTFIGMVLPIWMGMRIRLNGDGGFAIILDDKSYLFKPVSVQAMWTAIHTMDRAIQQAEMSKYLPEGLTHTWVEYYRSKVDSSNQPRLTAWHLMEDVEIFAPSNVNLSHCSQNEQEKMKMTISAKLKEVMMTVDLDEATCRSLRLQVEESLHMKLDQYLNYFDEELIRILGQMDAPSLILDYLYLGSEWNASNLEELQKLGIKYILNVTREIDNFYTGMFHYFNVRLYDVENADLMKYWHKTHKFIEKARKNNSKVLVHCKMGISRSASTVMAYLMKENNLSLDKAFAFVKERRSCVRPNKGFMDQLQTYEGILNASNRGKMFHSRSEHNILEAVEEGEGTQQGAFLGDSLFRMMSGSDWNTHNLSPEEQILLRKSTDLNFIDMEPDMETDSRSADSMEESLPDMPSPVTDQPPISLQLQVPVARLPTDRRDPSPRPSTSSLTVEPPGHTTRIKSDTSWIKLEQAGESTTDPPEAMEMKDSEDPVEGRSKESGQDQSPDPGIVFVAGTEATEDAALPCQGQGTEDMRGPEHRDSGVSDLGVHHYYSREQIPWNPGKVRNLRGEFMTGQSSSAFTLQDRGLDTNTSPPLPAGQEELDWNRSATESAGFVPISQSVGMAEAPVSPGAVPGEVVDEDSMETDEQARSVYEREDIHMTPGTVRRTLQQIEERQKLYGSREDLDSSMKVVKRSSSLREERETNKERDSERRRTCTPIVYPSLDSESEVVEGVEEAVNMETGVLKLGHHIGESSTDDVDMEEVRRVVEEEKGPVTMYTYGEETVPVKAGIVRRQKQEIENKSWEAGGWSHQRSQSLGTPGSIIHTEDPAEREQSLEQQAESRLAASVEDMAALEHSKQVASTHVPQSVWASPTLPQGHHHTRQCRASPSDTGVTEGENRVGECQGKIQQGGAASKVQKKVVKDCSSEGSRAGASQPSPRQRHCSDSAEEEHGLDTAAFPRSEGAFRPYAYSFPSSQKQGEKCFYDAKTLAMIREIGSALVSSPQEKEEDVGLSGTSLVKHLVKNIEKETLISKPERKIIIVSDSSQGKKLTGSSSEACHWKNPTEAGLGSLTEVKKLPKTDLGSSSEAEGKSLTVSGSSCDLGQGKNLTVSGSNSDVGQGKNVTVSGSSSDMGQGKKLTRTESGSSSLFSPSPEFLTNIERQLSQASPQPTVSPSLDCLGQQHPSAEARNIGESYIDSCGKISRSSSLSTSCASQGDGNDQAPSVVRHLRGRFEGTGHHCDYSEGEVTAPAVGSTQAAGHHCVGEEDAVSSGLMRDNKLTISGGSGFSTPRSLVEGVVDTAESLPHISHLQLAGSVSTHSSDTSQQSRRPCSAEHVPCCSGPVTPRCGSGTTLRAPAPKYRELPPDTPELQGCEGVKVRKLHGKSHPLSRLQQQQGSAPYTPVIQHHSSSHSSM